MIPYSGQIRIILGVLLLLSGLYSQNYSVHVFGFDCVDVSLETPAPDTVRFTCRTVGIIDLIWPVNNLYITSFDTSSFGLRSYQKNIHQGSFRQKVRGRWIPEDKSIDYQDKAFKRSEDCQSIFTLLARMRKETYQELDTRWFSLEHEGSLYKAHLLWADSVEVSVGKEDILCDLFRLDLILEEEGKFLDQSDYFSENITQPSAVRQIWIERYGARRIVQASFKVYGLPVTATLQHD